MHTFVSVLQVCVPYKPADVDALKETVEAYSSHLNDAQQAWWDDLLQRFADEDAAACSECVRLRDGMAKNASSKLDDADSARIKGSSRRMYYESMFKHLADDSVNHKRYDGPVLPPQSQRLYTLDRERQMQPSNLSQVNGSVDNPGDIPDAVEPEEDRAIVEEARELRVENTPVLQVGGSVNSARENRRQLKLKAGQWCIVRNTVNDPSKDPPWYVGIIINPDAGPMQVSEGDGQCDQSQTSVTVHECSQDATALGNIDPKLATHPTKSKHKPMYRKMVANKAYRAGCDAGTPELVEERMLRRSDTSVNVPGWQPVINRVFSETIGEYGKRGDIVTSKYKLSVKSIKWLNECKDIDWHENQYPEAERSRSGAGGGARKKRKRTEVQSENEDTDS